MPTITIDAMQIHYREQGESNQPVVLLIHGLGCSLRYWNCIFDAQEFSNYRILALDLPGFGLSEKPATFDYRFSSQANLISALLDVLKIDNFFLVGHSMGGAIATLLALKHPNRVKKLLVLEPNLKASEAQLSKDIVQYEEAEFIKQYEEFRFSAIDTVKTWFVDCQQHSLEEYIDELSKTTAVAMYRSAVSLIETTSGETLLHQFQQFPFPKYFFIGEETLKIRRIPKSFYTSDVHVVVVPGVGHMMMVDNPSLFNKTLATALQ